MEKEKVIPPEPEDYTGKQLNLFQELLPAPGEDCLSKTIELWDAAPWNSVTRRRQNAMREGDYLPVFKTSFVFKKVGYNLSLSPARVEVKNGYKEFYPSVREELVESVLRKFALEQDHGFLHSGGLGVSFTLYQIRKELKERGHTYSADQIKESLNILNESSVKIETSNKDFCITTSPLTSLISATKKDMKGEKNVRWHATFSVLVANAVKNGEHRQFDYACLMSQESQLTRWFYKRLCHNFTQASALTPYTVTLEGVKRDSGLLHSTRASQNKEYLEKSLSSLQEADVIFSWEEIDRKVGPRNAIIDIKYQLRASQAFTQQTMRANKSQRTIKESL